MVLGKCGFFPLPGRASCSLLAGVGSSCKAPPSRDPQSGPSGAPLHHSPPHSLPCSCCLLCILPCASSPPMLGNLGRPAADCYLSKGRDPWRLKIILDNFCPTAAGLAQQWWNKPVVVKEMVLSLCQSVCLFDSLSVCLSVSLYVFLSVCRSTLISAISHQQANMQCCTL